MNNNTVDQALDNAETTVTIDLVNTASGAIYPQASFYESNTMADVLGEYAMDIGVDAGRAKLIFTNKRIGVSTSQRTDTIKSLDLHDGDTLGVCDDGDVA